MVNLATNIFYLFFIIIIYIKASNTFQALGDGPDIMIIFSYCSKFFLFSNFLFFKTQKSKNYHTPFLAELGTLVGMGTFTHDPG